MITAYSATNAKVTNAAVETGGVLPAGAVWIDLNQPTPEEMAHVSTVLGVPIPTREEMEEIEVTSRLYREGDALVMTALVLSKSQQDPASTPVTFILMGDRLVSIRYADHLPFQQFVARLNREFDLCGSSRLMLVGLLEQIVDRAADLLELEAVKIDKTSQHVFGPARTGRSRRRKGQAQQLDLSRVLHSIGRHADLISKLRESLVTLIRLVLFLSTSVADKNHKDLRERVKMLARDLQSLSDQATYTSNKIQFLLDATLGLITIRQTEIVKIFSVVAVVFLPPTLIASIYGMNFDFMPELHWMIGYPLALGLMVVSAILPYLYFKWKGWL